MRLVKFKEGQQFKFFASNAIDVHAYKFQSTDKVIFTCAKSVFFSFVTYQIYFDFLSLTEHQKKNRKS